MELHDLSSRRLPVESPAGEGPLPKETAPVDNPPSEILQGIGSAEQQLSATPNLVYKTRGLRSPIPVRVRKWWACHISLVILDTSDGSTGGDPRDYLALERTFLAYVRTAAAVISLGVILMQLFLLKERDPLKCSIFAVVTSGGGIAVALIGCIRYFKQQKLLTRGRAISAGWDLVAVWATLVAMIFTIAVMLLAQD